MTRATETPVPNRLAVIPLSMYGLLEDVLANHVNYSQAVQVKRLKKVVSIAYRYGYADGYRDGHADAEDGHDERVIAHVNGEKCEEPDYLCDMCANDCDERKTIRVGQSAYDVCEKWQEAEE